MSKMSHENALDEFFAECEEIIQRVSNTLTKLEDHDLDQEIVDSLYRDMHTLKGTSQLFGFTTIGLIAHSIEASLEPVRRNKISLDRRFTDYIFKSLDLIDRIMKRPETELEQDHELQSELVATLPQLVTIATQKFNGDLFAHRDASPDESISSYQGPAPSAPPAVLESVPAAPVFIPAPKVNTSTPETIFEKKINIMEKTAPIDESSAESSTIRVQVTLLDKLMNLVGEMVLTRNQVLQYAKSSDSNEFLSLTQRLDMATTELQDSVMRTRMQPIGSVFTKFHRLVRDLSRDLGKNIDFQVQGAETELDKSLIEAIKDPLTHIVRNSCDHGIETPAIRKNSGKDEQGSLLLRAYHEGGQVIIEIKDDGKGIDPHKIRQKAVEKRVISPEKAATLSDKEAQELIFAAGFSTAEQVSSVSGRGVGMDVVRTNVERVGGMIELQSVAGQGTTLRLKIPLTLAIVPAMVIRSGADYYAVPQMKLQELIRVDMEESGPKIEKLQGQEVFRLRGQLLPLICCDQLTRPGKIKEKRSVYNIAVLSGESHLYGLVVDEICDTADIVVKPLPPFLKKIDLFSGATIMGDGLIALIIDVNGVGSQMKISHGGEKRQQSTVAQSKAAFKENTDFMLVRLAHAGCYAIPLVLVHRLEEFSSKDLSYSGNECVAKYRGSLLPLISLNDFFGYKRDPSEQEQRAKLSVVVVAKNNRLFGLVVDEVMDIMSSDFEITPHVKDSPGFMGSIIAPDKTVVTVLDSYWIVDKSMGLPAEKYRFKAKNVRVLFAEDTMFFVKQVMKVLAAAGLQVEHASDGVQALKLLKQAQPGYYDFILSDIEMPNMNGYELAAAVRADAELEKIPLIALTTRFTEADQRRGLNAGFTKYLEKLKSNELLEAIDQILGGK
jgi:two-component system, chemotaxis family, sensor kinase CheA